MKIRKGFWTILFALWLVAGVSGIELESASADSRSAKIESVLASADSGE